MLSPTYEQLPLYEQAVLKGKQQARPCEGSGEQLPFVLHCEVLGGWWRQIHRLIHTNLWREMTVALRSLALPGRISRILDTERKWMLQLELQRIFS